MKKLILLYLLSLGLFSCNVLKNVDVEGFTSSDNTIFFKGEKMAVLSNIEYSLDNKKLVKEMTFKLTNMNHADRVQNFLYFVHQKHKGWEIELDYPITNFKINN